MPITFDVDSTKTPEHKPSFTTFDEAFLPQLKQNGGKVVKSSNASESYVRTGFAANGLVAAALLAYNHHYELQLGPDEVWISITTGLSRYIEANGERLRDKFVKHEGKMELTAFTVGTLYSADYDDLLNQLSKGIDQNTKGGIKEWIESDFTTTTPLKRVVSKVVLMAAMKEYFSYKMYLMCGLPKVTLLGVEDDWKKIKSKVEKLKEFGDDTLAAWSDVLVFVIDYFIAAFSGKVDKDFWNRIAHIKGGGSGPRRVEGWILSLVGFDSSGKYFVSSLDEIKKTNSFGSVDKNEVPAGVVQVSVKINDNGVEHDTLFYAGSFLPSFQNDSYSPVLDWALVGICQKNNFFNFSN